MGEEVKAEPAAPPVPEREKLQAAMNAEKKARAQAVMQQIEKICADNNCQFIANPALAESPNGGWVIVAKPGVVAL